MPEKSGLQFTSSLTKKEYIAALAYLPVHVIGIPSLVAVLVFGVSDLLTLNIIAYSVGTVYMLALLGKFLRRDFDALCDHPVKFIVEIGVSYGIYYLSNFVIALILTAADSLSNPNNGAVIDMAMESGRQMVIMTVVMAPIVEELMFRAGVFGLLRKYNRVAAYAASMILFPYTTSGPTPSATRATGYTSSNTCRSRSCSAAAMSAATASGAASGFTCW